MAPETLKAFQDICELHRTTASDEVRRFIEAVVNEGKLPQTDEAMILPDVLDARIDEALKTKLSAVITDNSDVRVLSLEEKLGGIMARLEHLESDRLGKLAA